MNELLYNPTEFFLPRELGHKEWAVYVNHTRERQWSNYAEPRIPRKTGTLFKKVMFAGNEESRWKLLPAGTTATGDVQGRQLDCVEAALRGNKTRFSFTTIRVRCAGDSHGKDLKRMYERGE